jgi:hypothetical protein
MSDIDNAIQAMAETAGSWEERCYGIMAALNIDFGGFSTEVPDVGSWHELNNKRNKDKINELLIEISELEEQVRILSL